MDGQEVVGRLNARALLTPTERRSLNCGSAPAPAWRDDPERLKTLLDHDVDLHRTAVEERGSAWRSCPTIARRFASGALVRVLEDCCRPFPASSSSYGEGGGSSRPALGSHPGASSVALALLRVTGRRRRLYWKRP